MGGVVGMAKRENETGGDCDGAAEEQAVPEALPSAPVCEGSGVRDAAALAEGDGVSLGVAHGEGEGVPDADTELLP